MDQVSPSVDGTSGHPRDTDFQTEALDQGVYLERVKLLYSGIGPSAAATVIGMIILTYVNWTIVPHTILYSWFIYMCLAQVYRISLSPLFYKNIDLNQSNPKTWVKLYLLGTTMVAAGWGFAGSFLLSADSLIQQMFTIILLAGLSAGALATLSSIFTVYVVFLILTMVPLLVKLLSFGDDIHIAIAGLVLLFIIFILSAAKRMVSTITKSISLRFMHDAALQDIAEKKLQADELNLNLRQQISERNTIESHLESSMSQLKATLESTTDGILVIDNNDQITNFNRSFLELFSIPYTLIELNDFIPIQKHINKLLKEDTENNIRPSEDDVILLQLKDDRLIEVYSKPQKIANQITGSVISYRDATMRINSEASLQKAKNEAEIANNEKSAFLSRISHELRTPLNAILGFSQLLQEDNHKHLDRDETNYVSHINHAGEHLLTLIDDLLDISRIEAGKLNISLQNIPCKTIVEESLALIQPTADFHKIKVSLESDIDRLPAIIADHTRCKQALVNLLSNAIKYNRANGNVKLSVKASDSHVRFEVCDTGIGIDKKNFSDIFQPFTRLKQIEKTKGTGIGLTITKRLIDVMNGIIGVNSEPGVGSTFWFELPIATDQTAAMITETLNTESKPYEVSKMEKNHTILYVEDEPLNQALVKSIINQIPHTLLVTASTGEEGVQLALETQPDLILMDLNLPGISGYEALEILKNEKSFASTPVFAVTANAMPEEIMRGKEAGFFDYLIKPINIDNTRLLLSNTLSMLENKII